MFLRRGAVTSITFSNGHDTVSVPVGWLIPRTLASGSRTEVPKHSQVSILLRELVKMQKAAHPWALVDLGPD